MSRKVSLTANLTTADSVPHYPQEDQKLRATNIVQRRGGNGPNALEVLQQLTRRQNNDEEPSLVLCSVLPSKLSPATRQIESSFGRYVDLAQCFYRADHLEPASSYIIKSLASGSRTIVNYNALPEMTSAEFIVAADRLKTEAIWYHFEVRSDEMVSDKENPKKTRPHVSLTCTGSDTKCYLRVYWLPTTFTSVRENQR